MESQKRILIVDDNETSAAIVSNMLKRNGYNTEIVRNGEEALGKIKSCQGLCYDLILMDIELGKGMDGAETAAEIQQYCDLPVVFLFAHTEEKIIGKIRSVAKYGFVAKNAGEHILITVIDMALKLHGESMRTGLYQQIVEHSMNEIYIFDPETLEFIMVNRGARENLGYTMAELANMTPLDIKPEIEAQIFRKLIEPLLKREKERLFYNTIHRRKDGSSYPVEVNLQLYSYRGKKVCMALVNDLTERRKLEEDLREREALLSAVTQSAGEAIIMLDEKGTVAFWNPAAENLFGYLQEEILGKDLHRLVVLDEQSYRAYKNSFIHFQSTGEGIYIGKNVELKAKNKAGKILDVELTLTAVKRKKSLYTIGIVRDIGERKKAEEQVYFLTITDPLTKIYNRRYFTQKLEEEIERAKRAGNKFSLIMLDIDRFKRINDSFGHNAGDEVLKSMAELVKNRNRKIDIFARWGGEEFVILLPDTTVKNAARLAEELRESLSQMDMPGAGRVTASFGVAGYCPGDNVDSLVNKADNMMYEAKAAGRNCVRFKDECV
ncbi:GGDEF domain-containing response regulator [Petroclostridium xylanilyticum]|uniref:GGDEF domain-containing response regulator n=1 Tax=Petroclostridium xylanilyticum TaxID=1792311 RepID=UPI000B99A974|nr:diguanylate cyclase [Petroclostridium xylanilyticum]